MKYNEIKCLPYCDSHSHNTPLHVTYNTFAWEHRHMCGITAHINNIKCLEAYSKCNCLEKHSGTRLSTVASQQEFDSPTWLRSLHVLHVSSWFPPIVQRHAVSGVRLNDDSKLRIATNGCLHCNRLVTWGVCFLTKRSHWCITSDIARY